MKYYRLREGLAIKENSSGYFELINFGDWGCEACSERADCASNDKCEECRLCHWTIGIYETLQGALMGYASTRFENWIVFEPLTRDLNKNWELSDVVRGIADEVINAEKAMKKGEWES